EEKAEAWTGDGVHATRVEAWIAGASANQVASNENTLTLQILPWALRTFNYPEAAKAGERPGDLDAPVFVKQSGLRLPANVQKMLGVDEAAPQEGPTIWFNTALLAQAFERDKHGRIERRTQTESALKDQADAMHAPAKRRKITGGGGRTAYYRR